MNKNLCSDISESEIMHKRYIIHYATSYFNTGRPLLFSRLPLSLQCPKAKPKATSFSPSVRRRDCGFLHPPPAASVAGGWGNPRSAVGVVDRWWLMWFRPGGAMEVEVLPLRIMVPSLLPLFAVVLWAVGGVSAAFCAPRSSDLVSVCALRAVGEAMVAVTCDGAPVLRACPRRSGASPSVAAGLVSWCVWVGSSDSSPAQGCCKDGSGSGLARSRIECTEAEVRSSSQAPAASSGVSCVSKAWWCTLLQLLRRPPFFSSVAGGGDRKLVWWFSAAVASLLCIRMCMPTYVIRIVLPLI